MNSLKSLDDSPVESFLTTAESSIVSCKNLAISSFTLSILRRFSSWKEDTGYSKMKRAAVWTDEHLLALLRERARQHVGEESERKRKQELHEGDDDEDEEGHEPEDVSECADQLQRKKLF